MKKISFILLAGLTMLFASCQKETELPAGGPATYSIKATCDTHYDKLPKNGTLTVTVAAATEDIGVREQLTATFKLGGSDLVAKYNQTAEKKALEFPAGACAFTKNGVTVDRYNKNSRSAYIAVTNTPEMVKDALYVLPVVLESVTGSDNASCDASKVVYFTFIALGIDKGQGTKDKPYLIYEPDDFVNMVAQTVAIPADQFDSPEHAAAATPTYFKMMEDVDMTGVNWEPVNYGGSYNKKIDFNGNGKTIKNLKCTSYKYDSIFGVLFGDVYNFTVENAEITGNSAMGVVAGYIGTGSNIRGSIKHVTVKNSTVTGTGGDAKGVAIIAGRSQGCEIACCAAIGCTVKVDANFPGGILGYSSADGAYVHDCYFEGKVIGQQRCGAIAGMLAKNNDKIHNCIALGTVEGHRAIGGICGHANYDKWDERHPANEFVGCIAWLDEIISTSPAEDGPGNAAIVAFTSEFNTGTDCYRKSDMKLTLPNGGFAEGENNPGGKYNTFFDQPNFSESSPLAVIHDNAKKLYRSPYNGKAATTTASAIAKKLGWDENVWNLSGDVPVLK